MTGPSAPATSPAKTPKTKTPKAGRVKHVFVIALDSPGYDNAFGAQSEMPYLANTLRPQGELLSNYTLLTDAGLPNYIAMVGGQAPNALTSGNCTTYAEFPPSASPDRNGNVAGNGCVYPAQAINLADQLFSARFNWGAYMEDMGKPEPVGQGGTAPANPPQTCVHPDSGSADQTTDVRKAGPELRATPGRVTPPGTTRSSTSTPSSTWGAAASATCRSIASTARCRAGRRTSPSSRRTSAMRASRPSATPASRIRAPPRPTSSSPIGFRRSSRPLPTSRTAS